MRLRTHILLMGLLTGVLIEGAQAGEPPRGDCPPPPPGPGFMPGPGGPGGPGFEWQERGGPRHNFMIRVPGFAEFDRDEDGRVSRNEIDRALKKRFDEADKDNSGTLDAEEFADAGPARSPGPPPFETRRPLPPQGADCPCDCDKPQWTTGRRVDRPHHSRPDPKAAFNHFDWNLDGELSFEEFAAPIHQMALHLDRNGDGVVNADEMKAPAMFFGGPGPGFGPPPGHPPPRDR